MKIEIAKGIFKVPSDLAAKTAVNNKVPLWDAVDIFTKEYITLTRGNQTEAARRLGILRRHLTEIPDLPPYTCPQIDEVVEFINDLKAYMGEDGFGSAKIEDLSAMHDLLEEKADAALQTMEDIREANSDLRERQTYFEEENHNYEVKIEELEDLISELRNQE